MDAFKRLLIATDCSKRGRLAEVPAALPMREHAKATRPDGTLNQLSPKI